MSEIKRDILFRIIPSYLNTVEKYSIQEILPRKIELQTSVSEAWLTVETTLHTLTMYNIIVFKIYTLQNN